MGSQDTLWQRDSGPKVRVFEFLSRTKVMGSLTFLPVLLLLAFVYAIPIGWVVFGSFHSISAFSPDWEWVALENYTALFADSAFRQSLWRSVVFAVGSVVLQLVAGIALALLVNRSFKFKYLARTIVMLPYMVPTVVVGIVALWMGNSQYGIVNQLAARLGLIQSYITWFGSTDLTMLVVIVTGSWKFTIFVTIMVLARLQSIPDDYYEAAAMCGATAWDKFRDITLPNLKSVVFIVLLLRGVWMFNKFDLIWVTTRGGPQDLTTTAPVFAYEQGFVGGDLGVAAAVSVILFVILAVVATIYFAVLNPSEGVAVE